MDVAGQGATMTSAERPPGLAAVYGVAAVVGIAGLALTVGRVMSMERFGPASVSWLVLVAAFALTETFPIHFEHRREAVSFSLSTIPLVVGLYATDPMGLIAARVLGSAIALVLHRRQHLFKLVLNLSMFWLEAALIVVVFRSLVGVGASGPSTWAAAFAAAIASDVAMSFVLVTAISAYQRELEEGFFATIASGSVARLVDTSAALLVVTLLAVEPAALGLLVVVLLMLFVSYRVYSTLREQHGQLSHLYDFTSLMGDAVLAERVLPELLEQTRELLHAEVAWMEVDSGSAALPSGARVRIGLDGNGGTVATAIDATAIVVERPVMLEGATRLAAPLVGPAGSLGTLFVAQRRGEVRDFSAEDLRLFTTLANHATVSLGNARLLDQLRDQASISLHQSLHDSLTGLPNRVLFAQSVEARLVELRTSLVGEGRSGIAGSVAGHGDAESTAGMAAVLLIDLDRFKDVNDTLGHPYGDALLCEVGRRIRGALRDGDVIARLGGDEFAILLPDVRSPGAALHLAAGIVASLEQPFDIADVSIGIGASVGVAVAPEHGIDGHVLLQRADVAMYMAKADQSGAELYDLARDDHTTMRLALVGELRQAINDATLDVYYQPQIDLQTGRVLGAEALVRWAHPRHGFIAPDEFIPVAEQAGLIWPLTILVLRKALTECARWRRNGDVLRVSVNLSARSLLQAALPEAVAALLVEAELPASALCLELTETSMMVDPRRTVEVLHRLRALGVTIAIDDFGTGHSSLAYLKQLPVGEIKIDKSFVLGMLDDRFDSAIVSSIIDLARHLLVPVVAEGVESTDIERRLVEAGCAFGQGFGFSRPIPAEAFVAWMAAREPAAVVPAS